ncbi:hypothetical protein BDQ17DRAFT_1328221 [Cyathus striatus]|nr:hypothetical protein BDQ17DRAFT_1328221 [Cyathus striatus]
MAHTFKKATTVPAEKPPTPLKASKQKQLDTASGAAESTEDATQKPTHVMPHRLNKDDHPGYCLVAPKPPCHTQAEMEWLNRNCEVLEQQVEVLKREKAARLEEHRVSMVMCHREEELAVVDHIGDLIHATGALDEDVSIAIAADFPKDIDRKGWKVKLNSGRKKARTPDNLAGLDLVAFNHARSALPAHIQDKNPSKQDSHVGGLDDEDADSGEYEAQGGRFIGNEMVAFCDYPSIVSTPSVQKVKATNTIINTNTSNRKKAPGKGSSSPAAPAVKREDSGSSVTSNNAKTLPLFIQNHWKSAQSMIEWVFYTSDTPCTISTKCSLLVSTVQDIVDAIVLDSRYQVKETGCVIYRHSYNCIQFCCSNIGSMALKVVEKHFEQSEFTGNKNNIRKYTLWALQNNSPAFFRVPVPQGCMGNLKDINYKRGHKLFASQIIIDTISPFWKAMVIARMTRQGKYPKGLVAMATAGIECAFRSYLTGEYKAPDYFSNEKIETMVMEYMVIAYGHVTVMGCL